MHKWDNYFLDLAVRTSLLSKDPSSKFGAVVTQGKHSVGVGYNGLPAGFPDTDEFLLNRDTKIAMVIHAEENAILDTEKANRKEATIYVNGPPCARCAAKIAHVGIVRVICYAPTENYLSRWQDDYDLAQVIYKKKDIRYLEHPLP